MVLSRTGVASLTVLAGALVFAVVLGLVLAFGSGGSDPWEERWADLGVEEVEFVFLGNLTGREQESIRRELKVAQVVFAEHFGAVTSDFTVYVSTDLDVLNERLDVDRKVDARVVFPCGGRATPSAIAIVLEHCSPRYRARGGPLAHEYFHVLQHREGSIPVTGNIWPQWVVEGSAEYASALVSDARGRIPFDVRRDGSRVLWSALGRSLPRTAYSLADPTQSSTFIYSVGFLATDWLAERAGPEAILAFFQLGSDEAAFEQAFAMTLDEFEVAFGKYRLEAAPAFEWEIQGVVSDADGQPLKDMRAVAVVPIGEEWWWAGDARTDREGGFQYLGPGSGYAILLGFQCPRGDNISGRWVRAGAWGEDGFVADGDGEFFTADEWPKPFADGERNRTDLVIQIPTTLAALTAEHCES